MATNMKTPSIGTSTHNEVVDQIISLAITPEQGTRLVEVLLVDFSLLPKNRNSLEPINKRCLNDRGVDFFVNMQ